MGYRILVVDDEVTLVNTVRAYLEKEGYTVRTALDGQSAVREARTFRPQITTAIFNSARMAVTMSSWTTQPNIVIYRLFPYSSYACWR
jgi:CheY-like chemotaxis protein